MKTPQIVFFLKTRDRRNLVSEIVFLTVIVFSSFGFYGLVNFPFLNSDHCLNVLIADDFSLPRDFYCWGQDRGGMLIPLISQPFLWVCLSPLWAVSLSTYLILILGYFSFASFFKKPFSRVVFAIAWFLPLFSFHYLLSCPIGMQYSLLGMGLFLLKPVILNKKPKYFHQYPYVRIGISLFVFLLAVWVSDLSLVNLGIFGLVLWFYYYKTCGTWKLPKKTWTILAGFIAVTVGFLIYAKGTAMNKRGGYSGINDFDQMLTSLERLWERVVSVLIPGDQVGSYMVTIYAWLAVVLLIVGAAVLIKDRSWKQFLQNPWLLLFSADAIGVFGVCILSNWVFLNNTETRYFVSTYISLWIVVLLLIEGYKSRYYKTGVLILALVGSFSGIYSEKMESDNEDAFIPPAKRLQRFDELGGNVGIIGDYWYSFVISGMHTTTIKAVPHDQNEFRSMHLVREVLQREKLFVVGNNWIDSFPIELYQYGHVLQRNGKPFSIDGVNLCAYRVTPGIFHAGDPVFAQTPKQYDPSIQQMVLTPQFDSVSRKWIWKCPFYVLVGNIEAAFEVKFKTEKTSSKPKIWTFEAWGYGESIKTVYCSSDSLKTGQYHSITIPYSSPFGYTEFHITAPNVKDSLWIKSVSFDLKSLR